MNTWAGRQDDFSHLAMVRGMFVKRMLLLCRYPLNTLSQIGAVYIVFLLIFYGGRSVGAQALTNSLEGLIVGYFLWVLSIGAYSTVASGLTSEANWGTLEQMYMSPFQFSEVLAARIVISLFQTVLFSGMVLALILLTTGRTLHLDPISVFVLMLLAVAPVVGIGFVIAGIALVHKRVNQVIRLLQLGFAGLIAAPTSAHPVMKLLPLTTSNDLLMRSMGGGTPLWNLDLAVLALVAGKAVIYSLTGYSVFYLFTRRARKLGVLGHY